MIPFYGPLPKINIYWDLPKTKIDVGELLAIYYATKEKFPDYHEHQLMAWTMVIYVNNNYSVIK